MLSFFILGIDLTLNPSPEERDFLASSPLEKGDEVLTQQKSLILNMTK